MSQSLHITVMYAKRFGLNSRTLTRIRFDSVSEGPV